MDHRLLMKNQEAMRNQEPLFEISNSFFLRVSNMLCFTTSFGFADEIGRFRDMLLLKHRMFCYMFGEFQQTTRASFRGVHDFQLEVGLFGSEGSLGPWRFERLE